MGSAFTTRLPLCGLLQTVHLRFIYARFDEKLFEVLLPFKDAWRDGAINGLARFEYPSLCERVFSELLFGKSIDALPFIRGQLSQPFMSLPAIREWTLLRAFRSPSPLGVVEILAWLSVDARSKESKRLELHDEVLGDSVENLVQQLKKDFHGSEIARRYTVRINCERVYNGQPGHFVNRNTSEVLILSHDNADITPLSVKVQRKSMDEK